MALLLYCIKRLNTASTRHQKKLYVFLLSPMLLTKALCFGNHIMVSYRKFLLQFTYPSCNFKDKHVYRKCQDVHENSCMNDLRTDALIGLYRVARLYTRFYIGRFLFMCLLMKKPPTLNNFKTQVVSNIVRSVAFLGSQTLLQRVILCCASKNGLNILTPWQVFLLSIVSSNAILFEREERVAPINNMVIVHILLGWLSKEKKSLRFFTIPLILTTFMSDGYRIHFVPFMISLATAIVL